MVTLGLLVSLFSIDMTDADISKSPYFKSFLTRPEFPLEGLSNKKVILFVRVAIKHHL